MAEDIGLVASLITLAGASAQLARTLLDVANVIKSAEYEARLIAADINVFSSSLTQLSMVVDTPNIKTEKLREITVVLIAACKTLIEDLKMLIGEPVQHDPARRAFTISMVRFRFRWMKVGPKVMFVKSLIDSFKTTIIVLVSTINLAVVLERNAPESISESLKMQVESNIKFAEDATECLHYHTTVQQDEISSFTPTVDSSATTEVEDAAQDAGGELTVSRSGPRDERSLAVHDATQDDDFALQIFRDCTQAIELQQMSSALAKDVLDHPSRKAAWNWNASGSSYVHERADSVSDAVDPVSHSAPYSSPEPRPATEEYRDLPPSTRPPPIKERSLPPSRERSLPQHRERSPPPHRKRSLPHRRGVMHYTASEGESSTSDTGAYAATSSEWETPSPLCDDEPRQHSAATEESTPPKRGSGSTLRKANRSTNNARARRQTPSRYKDEETARYGTQQERSPRSRSYEVDRLANLEKLILGQKDEQLKREAAADAVRYAERQAADMKDAKIAEEKKAASEKAKLMLEAAQRAREAAEEKAAEEQKSIEAAHARALRDAKEARQESEKAKILAPKTSAPIIFHDPVGRKFEGPWHLCSTWEGMKEFLDKIGPVSAQVYELRHSKEYDLVRGDDVIILTGLWDSMVVPGSSITMRARTSAEKKVPWFRRSVGKGSG